MVELQLKGGYVVLVDDEDYPILSQFKWRIHDYTKKNFYAVTKINGSIVWLHNYVCPPPDDMEVDHVNHNTLDCRKENLRFVSHAQNCRNRQNQGAGVSFDKSRGLWRARLGVNYRRIHLGWFKTREEATKTVQEARIRYADK